MNAAAKVIHQSNVFSGAWSDMHISLAWKFLVALMVLVLLSALGVVYCTNAHRLELGQLQQLEQQSNRLQLQWGQLLLEQASLATPARVQALAQDKLHMVLPNPAQTRILRAQ